MTISSTQFAPVRLAAAVAETSGGRIAYFVANSLDPAQARREAIASIGRAVRPMAVTVSADLIFFLAALVIMALAIALGMRQAPYHETGGPRSATVAASRPLQNGR